MSESIPPFRYAPIVCSGAEHHCCRVCTRGPGVREVGHQSEAELEAAFITQLQGQAYEYLPITSEAALLANLRRQLEKLNKVTLSDAEWAGFFSTCIAGAHDGIVQKRHAFKKTMCRF